MSQPERREGNRENPLGARCSAPGSIYKGDIKMLESKYNEEGSPFGVFCTNEKCPYFERTDTHPTWSEDCLLIEGILSCPGCKSPMTHPKKKVYQELPTEK